MHRIYKWMPITVSLTPMQRDHLNRDLTNKDFIFINETSIPLKFNCSSPSNALFLHFNKSSLFLLLDTQHKTRMKHFQAKLPPHVLGSKKRGKKKEKTACQVPHIEAW